MGQSEQDKKLQTPGLFVTLAKVSPVPSCPSEPSFKSPDVAKVESSGTYFASFEVEYLLQCTMTLRNITVRGKLCTHLLTQTLLLKISI